MKKVLSLILALALVIMPMNTIAFDANTSSKAATVLDTQTFEDVQPGDQGQYSYLPSDYGTYAVTVTGAEGFQVGIYADPMMYNRPSSVLDDEAGVVETTVTTNMQLTPARGVPRPSGITPSGRLRRISSWRASIRPSTMSLHCVRWVTMPMAQRFRSVTTVRVPRWAV